MIKLDDDNITAKILKIIKRKPKVIQYIMRGYQGTYVYNAFYFEIPCGFQKKLRIEFLINNSDAPKREFTFTLNAIYAISWGSWYSIPYDSLDIVSDIYRRCFEIHQNYEDELERNLSNNENSKVKKLTKIINSLN